VTGVTFGLNLKGAATSPGPFIRITSMAYEPRKKATDRLVGDWRHLLVTADQDVYVDSLQETCELCTFAVVRREGGPGYRWKLSAIASACPDHGTIGREPGS